MEKNNNEDNEYEFNSANASASDSSQEKGCKNVPKRKHPESKETPRERNVFPKREHNVTQEEGKDRYSEDHPTGISYQSQGHVSQMQPSTSYANPAAFPNYYYGPTEHYNADPSRPYPMMSPYGMYPVNPWINRMEGMSSNSNPSSAIPVCSGMDMSSNSSTMMNNLPQYMMNVPSDPSLYGMMGGMGNFCSFPYMNPQEILPLPVRKEIIELSKSVLYPPNPNAPNPTLRDRPVYCRTIFVGGLPEKVTEEIVREAFEQFGEISTIRMSVKNFCHIRFATQESVEKSLYLSGYRMKIENKDEPSYSGRLHVDYAVARDDEYEHHCMLRDARRRARHMALEALESQEMNAPANPMFSDAELQNLLNQFRNGNFKDGAQVLVSWLWKDVNKRNAGTFFSIIQCLNHHVRRLLIDKTKFEQELDKAKSMLRQKMYGVSLQFNDIEKVFEAAKCQNVWDHFTKAQRKNIEMWKRQTSETKTANSDEMIDERVEDEMDMSEGEDADSSKELPKASVKSKALREQIEELREELASTMLEVRKAKEERNVIVSSVQQSLQTTTEKLAEAEKELEKFQSLWAAKSGNAKTEPIPDTENNLDSCNQRVVIPFTAYRTAAGTFRVSEREARLVALISAFLSVHLLGAHIDYICSYLVKLDSAVVTRDVENLMRLFPDVFEERSTGIGATLEKKWNLMGFKSIS